MCCAEEELGEVVFKVRYESGKREKRVVKILTRPRRKDLLDAWRRREAIKHGPPHS